MTNGGSRPTDVAIVGMAALFPGAPDLETYWHNIVNKVDAITDVPATRWDASYYDPEAWGHPSSDKFYCRRGGFIDDLATFEPARFGIMPVTVDSTVPDQLLSLRVAAEAIADAGGEDGLGDRSRVGVILGRGGYLSSAGARLDQRLRAGRQLTASLRELIPGLSEDQLDQVRQDFQARMGLERPEASIGLVPNLAASRIANRLDLQGPAYTVDAACASSLLAIDHGMQELGSGRCDLVVAGGVHVCDDVTLWSVFCQLQALSPSQQIRPFDRRADGLLVGEGTGMVVLKRLADAERDGNRIYAVVRGVGVASDGRDSSLMRPRVEGQMLALQRAWTAAGLDPTEPGALSLIEAHGTATPVGDETELTTLRRVFALDQDSDGPPIGIGSVKSMIGHAMPAAGMAGLIKSALAVFHRVLPPTLHCEDPHSAFEGTRLQPVTKAAEWGELGDGTPRRAVVNAFGFGGINAHVILEEAPNDRAPRRRPHNLPQSSSTGVSQPVLLLAGATAEDLSRQLAVDDAVLLGRDDLVVAPTGGPWRLAVVDPNPTRLDLARKVVARGRPWRGRNDVWFTSTPLLADDDAQVAFLFPGIEQQFDPQVGGVAAHFGLPEPVLPRDLSGTETLGAQSVATIAVGRLLDGALRQLAIEPDVVAGHSIGEWNAMIAAGMHQGADIDGVIGAFDQDSLEVPGVVFAALGGGAAAAAAAIAGLDRIVVSHDNCPHQSIICGDQASVAVALERLRAAGVMGQVLAFRSGFHTPMVAPYLAAVAGGLQGLPLRPATVPIWSATTVAPYPEDQDQIRALAIAHLLEPVRFGPMVQKMHDAGVRAFVQVGSGSLTGFLDDALRDRDQLVISACTSKNNGLDQLLRVAAALWVEGRTPNLARLAPAVPAAPARRDTGTVLLQLGTPVIHFAADQAPLVVAPRPVAPVGGHPILSEFDAMLADAERSAAAVLQSWQAPRPAPAPVAKAPTPALPTRVTTTRVVSVATMPYLVDHCFYRQAPGWPDFGDQFPVVPMTTMLSMMIDAARPLAGERTIVGLAKVRALRWMAPVDPITLSITAATDSDGNVDVSLEGYARAKVLVADRYPAAPAGSTEALRNERPAPMTAAEMYRTRWMFHGPAFQGVTALDCYADDGIRGQLVGLDAPGGLLDNAGQLLGFWILRDMAKDRLAFPAAIERIEFFGPHPSAGQPVNCNVWVRSVAETLVTADLEVCHPDGTIWARITGWTDRRFVTGKGTSMLRSAETARAADDQPGGWFLLRDLWPDLANRELVMRRYLSAAERSHYEGLNARGRHRWLLGRIAAKDAVRQWRWDRGAGPMFPAEVTIDNNADGAPNVAGHPGISLSLAHTGSLAVALVGEIDEHGHGVGIDAEVIEERSPQFEATACTEAERALLDHSPERLVDLTRFWTAKEAVAKAVGTGLGGRPRRFEVQDSDGTRLRVAALDQHAAWWVDTTIVDGVDDGHRYVVGWTATPADVAAAAAVATGRAFSPLSPLTPLTLVPERTSNGR